MSKLLDINDKLLGKLILEKLDAVFNKFGEWFEFHSHSNKERIDKKMIKNTKTLMKNSLIIFMEKFNVFF